MRNTDSTFTDWAYKETHGSVLSARHLKINSDIGDIDIDDIALISLPVGQGNVPTCLFA